MRPPVSGRWAAWKKLCKEMDRDEGVSLHHYQTERYKERIEYAMRINASIHNRTYRLSVMINAGVGDPTFVKLETLDGESYASYNGAVSAGLTEERVGEVAEALFKGLSPNTFADFPKNMPAAIKLRFQDGEEYTLKRKILRSQV